LACGFLFKVAAVPFHMWTPDVYEGAPTPITAFMSVGPKAAAFAMFLRVFGGAFGGISAQWVWLVGGAAALTMVWGNVAALIQDNVKRMLAYSSIAHAGYALVGLVAGGPAGVQSVLLYMLVYTVTNLGAFGFVVLLGSKGYAGETVQDYAGLARQHPGAAFGMLLCRAAHRRLARPFPRLGEGRAGHRRVVEGHTSRPRSPRQVGASPHKSAASARFLARRQHREEHPVPVSDESAVSMTRICRA
jgi:NADH:ubiquinone oxidoreductase subunit 4 (subunit M)